MLYGTSRHVLCWSAKWFESDTKSYHAYTTLSDMSSFFPVKFGLRAGLLESVPFCALGIPCAAVFKPTQRVAVENVLLSSNGGRCVNESIFIIHFHGGGYVSGGLYAVSFFAPVSSCFHNYHLFVLGHGNRIGLLSAKLSVQ
jgi:hypothetical protein